MDLEFTIEKTDFDIEVEVKGYVPPRPAPACSNPSSPLFSDSGDDAEYEKLSAWLILRGHKIKFTKALYEAFEDELWDTIQEEFEDSLQP